MKHYPLAEHHTFCVESGIDSCLLWKQVVKLGWLPEGIYHKPDDAFNPKQKAKQKDYQKKLYSTPEYKAKQKKYQSTPEYRAKKKEIDRRYNSTPEHKARRKEYDRKYQSTPEYKARRKEYRRNKK